MKVEYEFVVYNEVGEIIARETRLIKIDDFDSDNKKTGGNCFVRGGKWKKFFNKYFNKIGDEISNKYGGDFWIVNFVRVVNVPDVPDVPDEKNNLSYEWDLNFDIKTKTQLREEYKRMKQELFNLTEDIKTIERMAQEQGLTKYLK